MQARGDFRRYAQSQYHSLHSKKVRTAITSKIAAISGQDEWKKKRADLMELGNRESVSH